MSTGWLKTGARGITKQRLHRLGPWAVFAQGRHLERRQAQEHVWVLGNVLGCADAWLVQHRDGYVAAYHESELVEAEPEPDAGEGLEACQLALFG